MFGLVGAGGKVAYPQQKLCDLWEIPLDLERRELRLREWRRYLRTYRRLLKQIKDSWEWSKIPHLWPDAVAAYWTKRVEDDEKKRAAKRMAVRIMSPEEKHPRIMEYFGRNLGAPERRISLNNTVYVELFGGTAGGGQLRLKNVKWRHGEKLKLQMIPAQMSLPSIIQYMSVEVKLKAKNEAHIKDRHNHGNHDCREDETDQGILEDQGTISEDGGGSSGGSTMTGEDPPTIL